MHRTGFVVTAALALGVCGAAHAVFKCTDPKTGKVSYSDTACPSQATQAGVRITANVVEGQPAGEGLTRAQAQRTQRVGELIASGSVAVGMRESEVFAAWGEPNTVNTDLYSGNRVHKQMVFNRQAGTQYVYTENGIVTAVQSRPGALPTAAPEHCFTPTEIRNAGVSENSQRLSEAERIAIRHRVAAMKPC